MELVIQFLGILAQYGAIGAIVSKVVGAVLGLSAVITAFVAAWHAIAGLLKAVSMLPFIGPFVAPLASWLHVNEDAIAGGAGKAVGWIDQLSAIPLPQKKV